MVRVAILVRMVMKARVVRMVRMVTKARVVRQDVQEAVALAVARRQNLITKLRPRPSLEQTEQD